MRVVWVASVLSTSKVPVGWALPLALVGVADTLRAAGSPLLKVLCGVLLAAVATDKPIQWARSIALMGAQDTISSASPVVFLVVGCILFTDIATLDPSLWTEVFTLLRR